MKENQLEAQSEPRKLMPFRSSRRSVATILENLDDLNAAIHSQSDNVHVLGTIDALITGLTFSHKLVPSSRSLAEGSAAEPASACRKTEKQKGNEALLRTKLALHEEHARGWHVQQHPAGRTQLAHGQRSIEVNLDDRHVGAVSAEQSEPLRPLSGRVLRAKRLKP